MGAPVKNIHGQPSLSQKEGAQERGFWLLALSRVRNKVKALSLLGKQTVCAWAFYFKDQEMVWRSADTQRAHLGGETIVESAHRIWHLPQPPDFLAVWHQGSAHLAELLFPYLR